MGPSRAKRKGAARPPGAAALRERLLERELRRAREAAAEAIEQQAATVEVLSVMSASQHDAQPVFDSICRKAVALCGSLFGVVHSYDGERLHFAAHCDLPIPQLTLMRELYPMAPSRSQLSGRAIITGEVQRAEDLLQDPDYPRALVEGGGWRRLLTVPMAKAGKPLGAISVGWREPGPISDRQVDVLRTFAEQAIMALENVRLFNETREALERQTATAEILRVIAASPADVQPVFEAIIKSASRLAGGCSVNVSRLVGDQLHLAAYTPVSPEADEVLRTAYPVSVGEARPLAEAVRNRAAFSVSDFETDPEVSPKARELMRARGFRSTLYVPIMHGDVVHGVMHVSKVAPGPFPQQWIDLLRTFADQAVIAIENVRLFNETSEALERQTAISEILRVMSASPTDVQPVFQTIVSSAARLCNSTIGAIFRYDGERIHYVAGHNFDDASRLEAIRTKYPARVDSSLVSGRVIQTLSVVHIDDAASDPRYDAGHARLGGWRRMMGVPMLKDGVPVGVIVVAWDQPGVTPKSQEELLKTFADQAVIAVENMRLFNETRESLERQTATTEVLKVISQARIDLEPVLDIVLRNARRLCDADRAIVFRADSEGNYSAVAVQAAQSAEEVMDFYRRKPIRPGRGSATGRALLECRAVQVADVHADPEYRTEYAATRTYRTILAVPLLREGIPIGVLTVSRTGDPRPFSDKQIELVTSFADQAVIAIENVRLFNEIQEKSRQLEQASRHKSEFLANMSHELRTPLNAIIGFTRIVMRRSKEQIEPKQYENLEKIHSSGQHLLALINAILDLSKVEAGRVEVTPAEVALGAVLEQCMKTVEPLVKAPAVRLVKEFDAGLPRVYADEEKLRQIVMNLLGNAAKFTERGSVRVRAGCSGERFAVAVADTGIGIPADKLEHVFDEFAQADASSTRVYGGTGLGLTIARRLARLMGGDISAESSPGLGSTFTLTLPLRCPV